MDYSRGTATNELVDRDAEGARQLCDRVGIRLGDHASLEARNRLWPQPRLARERVLCEPQGRAVALYPFTNLHTYESRL